MAFSRWSNSSGAADFAKNSTNLDKWRLKEENPKLFKYQGKQEY
jgi:hypothetical protein